MSEVTTPLLTNSRPLTQDTVNEAAAFFTDNLGKDQSILYVKRILAALLESGITDAEETDLRSNKRVRNEATALEPNVETSFGADSLLLRDSIDAMPISVVLLVPEDLALIAFIIGKGGANLSLITSLTECKVQVEKLGVRPVDSYRHITCSGTVSSTFQAVSQVFNRGLEFGNPSLFDCLRIVVPNEIVSRIIGKGGIEIKKLQESSGLQKIDIQQEADMLQRAHLGYYGRTVTMAGKLSSKFSALYTLLRQFVEDKTFPEAWRGNVPRMQFASAPSSQFAGVAASSAYGHSAQPMASVALPPPPTAAPPASYLYGIAAAHTFPAISAHTRAGVGLDLFGAPQPSAVLLKQQISVPSDKACIGHVIGMKGAQIDEIQRCSGCKLQVEPDMGIGSRLITIEGSDYGGIKKASDMVIAIVQDWMRRTGQEPANTPINYPRNH